MVGKIRPKTTAEIFEAGANKFGDCPALSIISPTSCKRVHSLTYKDLFEEIKNAEKYLTHVTKSFSTPICIGLPNLIETHVAIWASEIVSAAAPINPYFHSNTAANIFKRLNTRVLITVHPSVDHNIFNRMSRAVLESNLENLIIIRPKFIASAPKDEVILSEFRDLFEKQGGRVHDFNSTPFISGSDSKNVTKKRQSDIAAIFHTGGTTGQPKLAQHSHSNEVFMAAALAKSLSFSEESVVLCGLPMFHVNAVMITGLATFFAGGHVILLGPNGFRDQKIIKNFWTIVERTQATCFSAVPTVYSRLLSGQPTKKQTESLEFGICGAAPISESLFRNFEAETDITIIEGYGLTETTCASSLNPVNGLRKIGSIGKPISGQSMQICKLGSDNSVIRQCASNEIGSIVVKGPNVFVGYTDSELTKRAFTPDGWFITGDLGWEDEEGYFWLSGREKDLIIRGGHNIDPAIIEEAVERHPNISLAAAVGQPDFDYGEIPVCFVVLKEGCEKLSEGEVISFVSEKIGEAVAIPKNIYFITEMPVTEVGKIFKPRLREIAVQIFLENLLNSYQISGEVQVSLDPSGSFSAKLEGQRSFPQEIADKIALLPAKIRL